MIGTKKYTGKNGKDFVIGLACADDFKESIETYAQVAREKIYLNTEDFSIIHTGLGLGFFELVEAVMLGTWTVYTGAVFLRK